MLHFCPPKIQIRNFIFRSSQRILHISTLCKYSTTLHTSPQNQMEEDDYHTVRFPSPSADRVEKLLQYTIEHLPKNRMENLNLIISDDTLQQYKKELQQFIQEQQTLYQQEMNNKELYLNEEQLQALGLHFVLEILNPRDKLSESESRFVIQFLLLGDSGVMDMDKKKELKKQIKQRHETENWATKELSRDRMKELLETKNVQIDESKPLEQRKFTNLTGTKMFNNKTGNEIDDDDH